MTGVVRLLLGVTDDNFDPRPLVSNGGTSAGMADGEALGPVFPGLGDTSRFDVANPAQIGFANAMNSGRTGVFWRLPGQAPRPAQEG